MAYRKPLWKPSKIEALEEHSGADGERIATQNVKETTQHRLRQGRETEFPEEATSNSVEDAIFQSEMAPTRLEIIAKLNSWQNSEWSQNDLVRWARSMVDKVFFDELSPEHPDLIPVELTMICSAMDRRAWRQADIGALMNFAQSSPEEPLNA